MMKRRMHWLWSLQCGLLCAATACTDYKCNDFSEYHSLKSEEWRYDDTLRYLPVHDDSVCRGRLAVAVSHTGDYPYTELWLEVTHRSDSVLRRDTVAMQVADRFGSWLGQGIGSIFQISDTLAPGVHVSGSPVLVRQIMRRDTLPGINRVGLFFVPIE